MLWQQKQQLQYSTKTPVLVFTMAKVGSSSVYHSIKKQTNIPCFHIHSLSIEEALHAKTVCKEKGIYPGSRTPVFLLQKQLLEQQRRYKVISLFRNPIERNISAFFEAFEIFMGVPAYLYKGSFEEMEAAFYKNIDHSYCKEWFDKHFKTGTGIDVYKHDFNKEKGYISLQNDLTDVLLLKSNLNDSVKAKLIGDFCGIEHFKINNVNITGAKKEAMLYCDFKSHIRFSQSYLESQLESKYMRHFFTTAEKEALYVKWMRD